MEILCNLYLKRFLINNASMVSIGPLSIPMPEIEEKVRNRL